MSSLFLREFAAVPVVGESIALDGAEAKHAVTVNRVRVGERVLIGDGAGILAHVEVTATDPKHLSATVLSVAVHEPDAPALFLVQALAKGDRDEMAVQAATELGVSGVIPWQAERSISRWQGDKLAKGQARWATISREASKQTIRPFLPEVRDLVTLAGIVALVAEMDVLVLDPTAEVALTAYAPRADRNVALVVGPEGGISAAELEALEAAGAQRVRLGDTILRTSTAGPSALAVLNAKLGRW